MPYLECTCFLWAAVLFLAFDAALLYTGDYYPLKLHFLCQEEKLAVRHKRLMLLITIDNRYYMLRMELSNANSNFQGFWHYQDYAIRQLGDKEARAGWTASSNPFSTPAYPSPPFLLVSPLIIPVLPHYPFQAPPLTVSRTSLGEGKRESWESSPQLVRIIADLPTAAPNALLTSVFSHRVAKLIFKMFI